jgi:hypothetical protein
MRMRVRFHFPLQMHTLILNARTPVPNQLDAPLVARSIAPSFGVLDVPFGTA